VAQAEQLTGCAYEQLSLLKNSSADRARLIAQLKWCDQEQADRGRDWT